MNGARVPVRGPRRGGFAGAWVALAAGLAVLAGCGGETPRDESHGSPEGKRGIVTFAPHLTETVFALGQGDRVVGVSSFCDYPPEAVSLERLGGYLDPNLEKITMLRPELIIVPGEHRKVTELAEQIGIPLLHVHMDSLETIRSGIETIGAALECEPEAAALWARIEGELAAVRRAVEGLPRPRVLIIHARVTHALDTLFTAGRSSFVSELVDVAGGTNLFEDAASPYFEASKETVVVRAPEVIIEFHAGASLSDEEQARFVSDWQRLPSLPAVQQGRIHLFLDSYGLRPGPRVARTAAQLARMIHPEAEVAVP